MMLIVMGFLLGALSVGVPIIVAEISKRRKGPRFHPEYFEHCTDCRAPVHNGDGESTIVVRIGERERAREVAREVMQVQAQKSGDVAARQIARQIARQSTTRVRG